MCWPSSAHNMTRSCITFLHADQSLSRTSVSLRMHTHMLPAFVNVARAGRCVADARACMLSGSSSWMLRCQVDLPPTPACHHDHVQQYREVHSGLHVGGVSLLPWVRCAAPNTRAANVMLIFTQLQ